MSTYAVTYEKLFTKTHAEGIASKIAADLYQFHRLYNFPSEQEIKNYTSELISLLVDGYMKYVTYGFKKNGEWVLALRYEIHEASGALRDDNAGGIPIGKDITGAQWGSFLYYSPKFENLIWNHKQIILSGIPIKRSSGTDQLSSISNYDKTYSAGNINADRKVIIKP